MFWCLVGWLMLCSWVVGVCRWCLLGVVFGVCRGCFSILRVLIMWCLVILVVMLV